MKAPLSSPAGKREFNRQLFTAIAGRYDFITAALSLGRDAAWKRRLLAALPAWERPRCVDLACGTGQLTRLLARRYPRGTVVGLDLTGTMLELARAQTLPSNNIWYVAADMGSVSLKDGSADIVTGGYALRNAPHLETALREIHRLLRPGGLAAFLDFSKPAAPPLQQLELALLKIWGALWGWAVHRNPHVYGYIADSLAIHPHRRALHALFERSGFRLIQSRRFFGGITELIIFEKT